ncbi:MAG: hypothetical protein RML32_05370 [Gammaproteobacteria bacterium]|nr:hypothetical protein [Gammaproteobacteria bacterium]
MPTLTNIAALAGTEIKNQAASSYTWSNVTIASGRVLLAVAIWHGGTNPATFTVSHPALSNVTLLGEATGYNTTEGRCCRLRIYEAQSNGANGTLTVTSQGSSFWQGAVNGWLLGDAGSLREATSAATTGDTSTSLVVSPPSSPTAAAGLAVGAAVRTGTSADVDIVNWTTAKSQKGLASNYFTMAGAGFVDTQPGNAPTFQMGSQYARPLVGLAVRFAPTSQASSNANARAAANLLLAA